MEELYLPVLSHFQNGNIWTASDGRLKYKITPGGEELSAEAWEGPWSYELSRVEEQRTFPLDEGGLEALAGWIRGWSAQINARPPKSLEETLRARDARRAELEAARDAEKTE